MTIIPIFFPIGGLYKVKHPFKNTFFTLFTSFTLLPLLFILISSLFIKFVDDNNINFNYWISMFVLALLSFLILMTISTFYDFKYRNSNKYDKKIYTDNITLIISIINWIIIFVFSPWFIHCFFVFLNNKEFWFYWLYLTTLILVISVWFIIVPIFYILFLVIKRKRLKEINLKTDEKNNQ